MAGQPRVDVAHDDEGVGNDGEGAQPGDEVERPRGARRGKDGVVVPVREVQEVGEREPSERRRGDLAALVHDPPLLHHDRCRGSQQTRHGHVGDAGDGTCIAVEGVTSRRLRSRGGAAESGPQDEDTRVTVELGQDAGPDRT